jgi:uncharacterized tellurite resistance protein B-like protein
LFILRTNFIHVAAWQAPCGLHDVEIGTVLLDDIRDGCLAGVRGWKNGRPYLQTQFSKAQSKRNRIISISMLAEIKRLFAELHVGGKHGSHFDADDCRVASAALLVHVATLDHDLTSPARHKLAALLGERFSLNDALTDELIEAAIAADREAVDLYHFTHLLMRTLDEQGRLRVVEMLWEMAFADGSISEFEDNMMWRVADLLAVSPHDRIALRQQAAGKAVGQRAGSERDKAGT